MSMDYKHIERLLERYWECRTSPQEEAVLRAFFASDEVPSHLLPDRDLFLYQLVQQEVGIGEGFEERMLQQINAPAVKARRITLFSKILPLCRAAAVVFGILFLSNAIQRSFSVGEIREYDTDTFDDPAVAYEEVTNVLMMLSEEINKSAVATDSLGIPEIEKR